MKKIITLGITVIFVAISATAQTYHEDDKEGLRMFLRQPSAQKRKINAEQLGLKIKDTINWQKNEAWVTKVKSLIWNEDTPKRLIEIYNYDGGNNYNDWAYKNLAGTLDASKWTKLRKLSCPYNKLNALNLNANTELQMLSCFYNSLIALDIRANTKLQYLYCGHNQIRTLDIRANMELKELGCYYNQLDTLDIGTNENLQEVCCYGNRLSLSNLFAVSEILKKNGGELFDRRLGFQTLSEQTINLNTTLDFSTPQNIFNGIYTEFTVEQDEDTVPESDYTVTEGKITFHKTGIYDVRMTNKAIITSDEYPSNAKAVVAIDVIVVK